MGPGAGGSERGVMGWGAEAGGSERGRDGGGRRERGLPVRGGTQRHTSAFALCVNFVVGDRKPSLNRCSGKAGREERIHALVHGAEF